MTWTWAQPLSLWRSASLIIRSFTRAKGFALAALLVVALGVGVNAVVFSLFDRVLFRPLPYHEPDRLVQLQSHSASIFLGGPVVVRLAVALALARETDIFTGIGWARGGDPEPLVAAPGENPLFWFTGTTTNTLDVLGIHPAIGAGLSAFPATTLERPVMLTYDVWQQRYGASSDVLSLAWTTRDAGQRNIHWRVVGVLPPGFLLPTARLSTAPFDGIYGLDPGFDRRPSLDVVEVAPFARLPPGVPAAVARAQVNAFTASRFPQSRNPITLRPEPTRVSIVPLQSGLSTTARSWAWLAVIGAWAVLAATCLTLAVLFLTWSQSRRQDAGVRLALGASPRRLVATALVESAVLCGIGAVIGLLAYVWARPLFVSLLPPGLQAFATETAEVRVIAVASFLALVTAVAGGLLPAIRTARMAPLDAMRPSRNAFGRVDGARVLLGVQAALGVILLVGALAVLPGVLRVLLAHPGFDATDLFVVNVPTARDESAWDAREQTRRGLAALELVRRSPGVVSTALSGRDPFRPSPLEKQFPHRSGFDGLIRPVDADFFQTLAVPLTGRAFSHADIDQPALVAIVNEAAARALWPGVPVESVVGLALATLDGSRTIIGVAADFRVTIDAPAESTLFLPLSANEAYSPAGSASPHNSYQISIRMAPGRRPDGALLSQRLRQQPWMSSDWVGVTEYFLTSVQADVSHAHETPRLLALIFTTLGGITLLLTTIAIYGLARFEIRRRREEMTVRLALGATPRSLRRRLALVIVKPVAIGVLVGLPFGWVQVKLVGLSLPFVNAGNPQIYLASATVIVVAALVSAWLPGRRFFLMRVAELLRG